MPPQSLSDMATLLVTYFLAPSASGDQYAGLQAALKSVGPYVRLNEGTYVVDTVHSPATVYQSLLRHIYKNDRLLVLRVNRPYFGQHSSDVVEWLNARL